MTGSAKKIKLKFISSSIFFLHLVLIPQVAFSQELTIAVLDFISKTGDSAMDAMLSVGTTETVITDLSNVQELTVVERTRLRDINNELAYSLTGMISDETILRIGRQFGASYLVVGGWQQFAGRYRVNCRIISTETLEIIASIKETGSNIFNIQDEISKSLLSNIGIKIDAQTRQALEKRDTISIEAFQEFSKGLVAIDKGDNETGVQHMKEAERIDPTFQAPKKYLKAFSKESFEVSKAIIKEKGGKYIQKHSWQYTAYPTIGGMGYFLALASDI